jgi:Fe-S-cluster containining protein
MLASIKQWLLTGNANTESQERGCLCCGECCRSFGSHLHASEHDLDRWQREGRADILSRVNRLGWIWVDPETKELEERCPFIQQISEEQSICAIQDTKPDICRDYPTLAHGKRCLKGVFLEHCS